MQAMPLIQQLMLVAGSVGAAAAVTPISTTVELVAKKQFKDSPKLSLGIEISAKLVQTGIACLVASYYSRLLPLAVAGVGLSLLARHASTGKESTLEKCTMMVFKVAGLLPLILFLNYAVPAALVNRGLSTLSQELIRNMTIMGTCGGVVALGTWAAVN